MRNEEGYRDDITIEEEATEQEVRSKLEIGHIIPDFRLQTVDGRVISPTDYKEKKNLVVLFFDPRNSCDWEMLAEVKRRYPEFADNNAEVLGIASGPMEEMEDCVATLKLPFPLLHDARAEATCAYCATLSSVFVADRYGELRFQGSICEAVDETLGEVVSTLELIEIECPECGAPSWPQY